jgi:hypothetical protein
MATDPHQIQLSAHEWELLADLSFRTGKSPEEVLANALRYYNSSQPVIAENGKRGESMYEVLARKGLIGCVKGGPPDLSTNPKYMEGFGESSR